MKVEQHFSAVKTASYNRGILGENTLKNTPRNKCLRNKKDGSSPQAVEIINFDDLEVASPVKMRARTKTFTMSSKIMRRSVKNRRKTAARSRVVRKAQQGLQQRPMS